MLDVPHHGRQCRDADSVESRTHPRAGIDERQLFGGEIDDRPLPVRGAVQIRVVEDDGNTVGAGRGIDLDEVDAEGACGIDRGKAVLGNNRGIAAMGDHQWAASDSGAFDDAPLVEELLKTHGFTLCPELSIRPHNPRSPN